MSWPTIHSPLDVDTEMSHNVYIMAKGDTLGEFELLILAALMMLGDNAYGMTIHEQTEKLAAGLRTISIGSVYTTLDRLGQKGYPDSLRTMRRTPVRSLARSLRMMAAGSGP